MRKDIAGRAKRPTASAKVVATSSNSTSTPAVESNSVEVAAYLADMAGQLSGMAQEAGLSRVGLLLELAGNEAKSVQAKSVQARSAQNKSAQA